MKINLTLLKLIKTLNLDIFNIRTSRQFRIFFSIIIQKEFLGDINIQKIGTLSYVKNIFYGTPDVTFHEDLLYYKKKKLIP